MPNKIKRKLEQVSLSNPLITLSLEPDQKSAHIEADIRLYNSPVHTELTLMHKENKFGESLRIELPPNWQFDETFPELKNKINMTLNNAYFILSTYNYLDKKLNLDVTPGLTFSSNINMTTLNLPIIFDPMQNFIKNFAKNHTTQWHN
jgi:hypothetical protein